MSLLIIGQLALRDVEMVFRGGRLIAQKGQVVLPGSRAAERTEP
jgi:hypothetical protein